MQNTEKRARPAPDADPTSLPDGQPTSRRGIASDVVLDGRAREAAKRYRRQPLISALYRLVFQAPFPYVTNLAALKAAKYRRRIAGLITRYLLGRDVVAPVKRVDRVDGGYVFVTELVDGGPPRDRRRARAFLHQVTDAFIKAGLPTWQVSPYNPRSLGNLMETPDGDYRIIDLESNVVTPMVPLSEIWGAARTAHLPPFDDIDLPRLMRFVAEHQESIAETLGEDEYRELARAIARYAWYEDLWQKNEPRIFSRALRRIVAVFDFPGHVRAVLRTLKRWGSSGTRSAEQFVEAGIARWQRDGVITDEQAARARADLESGPVIAVLGHLGGQFAMSIPLRFPFGSLARFIWASAFRLRAELRALLRRATPEETRTARGIHSLPVIVVAAIPGLGAAAYVLATPLRKNQVLLGAAVDQATRLLPLRLYERLHLQAVTVDVARREALPAPTLRERIPQLRSALASLQPHWPLLTLTLGANAAALAAAGGYFAATGSLSPFRDFGPIATIMILEALAAGALGVAYYRGFWSRPDAGHERPGAAGTLFWFGGGLAFVWLAIDQFTGVRPGFGDLLDDIPVLEYLNDLILLGYLIAGIIFVRIFGHEVESHGPTLVLLGTALALAAATVGIDALAEAGSDWTALEKVAQLLTVSFVLPAFLIKYRELAATGERQ